MGTRGAIGFYKNGENKIAYNHYDSYPDYLGKKIINFLVNTTNEELNTIFDKIEFVDEDSTITQSQIDNSVQFLEKYCKNYEDENWYQILSKIRGDFNAYKTDLKYMIGGYETFIGDSLMCEYAYIINLTEGCLEFYKGGNKILSNENDRYKCKDPVCINNSTYYGCSLVRRYDFDIIRQFPDKTLKDMKIRSEE